MSSDITRVAVYPPIGIARVGNSPEHYLAPEVPGLPAFSPGGYKDAEGRVKKQVVRFRIYGFNEAGEVVREITADEAEIEWRVHVANHKAAWYQFNNALDLGGLAIPGAPRNGKVSDRSQLVIDPGPRTICGRDVSGPAYRLTGGKFFGQEVPLGKVETDGQGRLLFFGGDGHSASKDGSPATTFANNDGWHDDVSDGPVRATVRWGERALEAEPAVVAVTPPNFGQGLFGTVTLYDVVLDLFVRSGWIKVPERPSFWGEIFPLFRDMTGAQWVNYGFYVLFGESSPSDPTSPALLAQLADPSEAARPVRERFLAWFRNPASFAYEPAEIPPYYGDAFGDYTERPNVDLAVTATQYGWLEHWANGNFDVGERPCPKPFEDLSPAEQIGALAKTPLEECLGGPFHPGIELTWPLRNLILWQSPFRLKVRPEGEPTPDDYGPLLSPAIALAPGGPLDGSGPGSLSRYLGVPWQTDEASCLSGYDPSTYLPLPSFWATRVPNQVLAADSFKRLTDPALNLGQRLKHLGYRQDWLRDLGTQYQTRINNMVRDWWQLGIVAPQPAPADAGQEYLPAELWVESDRGPFNTGDPTFEQVLRAENAHRERVVKAAKMLAATAGHEPEERPARPRRSFARDQR